MSDFIGSVFIITLAAAVLMFGFSGGRDSLRKEIINACIERIERNPDMANSKIKTYCDEYFDTLLIEKKK